MGLVKTSPGRVSSAQSAAVRAEAVSLPASVDLTPYAMPVGNQGQVGSCAAWATDYSALGYWQNKQGIPGGGLEPMYTYSQVTGGHDVGSSIEGNLQIDEQGVDNQTDYWQGNYDYWDMPATIEKAHAVNWKLTGFANLPIQPSPSSTLTQQSIEGALAAGLPVVIGIPVYDNFFYVGSANAGYYGAPSGNLDGYHAIAALGYNSNGLVIENSWGTGWGNRGYATLSWSFVNRYVFDAVSVSPMRTGQPVNTATPSLPAAAHQGQPLTVTNGNWSPSATSYAYQWQRESTDNRTWTPITGGTASAYTPGSADLGRPLRVLVTATNSSGQGAATSSQTGSVTSGAPTNLTAPTPPASFALVRR
jgi:Papain family cysteine protease